MNREEMLVELLAVADKEIKSLKEQVEFLRKEVRSQQELANHLAAQVFGGTTK
jgi:hypothetical protein